MPCVSVFKRSRDDHCSHRTAGRGLLVEPAYSEKSYYLWFAAKMQRIHWRGRKKSSNFFSGEYNAQQSIADNS